MLAPIGSRPALAWVVLLVVFFSAPVCVQASVYKRCEKVPDCNELLVKAKGFTNAGNIEAALSNYQAAYQVWGDPLLLYNAARILHRAGRASEAVGFYQRVLDSGITELGVDKLAAKYLGQAHEEMTQPVGSSLLGQRDSRTQPLAAKAPVYKRPWFWVLIGIAGAAVVGGVVAGIVVGTSPPSGTQPFVQQP